MPLLLIILLIVYVVAVNVYGVLILYFQKKAKEENLDSDSVSDFRLILAGLLGGAVSIYTFMYIFKYRLKSAVLMILMPVFATITIYLVVMLCINGFNFTIF